MRAIAENPLIPPSCSPASSTVVVSTTTRITDKAGHPRQPDGGLFNLADIQPGQARNVDTDERQVQRAGAQLEHCSPGSRLVARQHDPVQLAKRLQPPHQPDGANAILFAIEQAGPRPRDTARQSLHPRIAAKCVVIAN